MRCVCLTSVSQCDILCGMDSYETKWFKKWARKKGLSSDLLIDAVERTKQNVGVVDLGGGLYKIRIGREGQGRSGGFRTILAFKFAKRALFLYGFEKSDQDNIDKKELGLYKEYAKTFLELGNNDIQKLIDSGTISPLEDV